MSVRHVKKCPRPVVMVSTAQHGGFITTHKKVQDSSNHQILEIFQILFRNAKAG